MRSLLVLLLAAALVSGAAAQGGDPEVPEKYIKVDEVKALLDRGKPVVLIDVRPKEQYDELHIRGARNIPLRELLRRLGEVPRQDFVVLY
jgi:rhodanese-related sulfurtransferase